jgi:hypothetical protein
LSIGDLLVKYNVVFLITIWLEKLQNVLMFYFPCIISIIFVCTLLKKYMKKKEIEEFVKMG